MVAPNELLLWVVLSVINLTTLALYGADKRKAQQHRWRIPETVLLLFAALGGALGAWCGMKLFHHKTKHRRFQICVPGFLLVQLGLLACLYL